MHFLESFALTTGLKISKPDILLQEINLPKLNYITFHPICLKAPARQYKKWGDVITKLKGAIKNVEIIQIGDKGIESFDVNTDYLGNLTVNQLAFLIKNSQLHLGYDSFPMHLASAFDRKIVSIFSCFPETCGPYFSRKEDIVLLEPNYPETKTFFGGRFFEHKLKPSFMEEDEGDLINTISVDSIVSSVIKLLNNE